MADSLSIFECQTHDELLKIIVKFYKLREFGKDDVNLYLSVIGKIPFWHVGTAIVEWLEHYKWMPQPSEWREIAAQHWEDAERQRRLSNPRIEQKPGTPMTSNHFREHLKQEAECGGKHAEFAAKMLKRLERNDRKVAAERMEVNDG